MIFSASVLQCFSTSVLQCFSASVILAMIKEADITDKQ